ncbi:hypothetical protein GCM10027423_34450 [Spirosoma arcticum]
MGGFKQEVIPGTQGQPHVTIAGGGHFVQEDNGDERARLVMRFIQNNPVSVRSPVRQAY